MDRTPLSEQEQKLIDFALEQLGVTGEGVQQYEFDNLMEKDTSDSALALERKRLLRQFNGRWVPTIHAMAQSKRGFRDFVLAIEHLIAMGKSALRNNRPQVIVANITPILESEFPKLGYSPVQTKIFHHALYSLDPFINVDSAEGDTVKVLQCRPSLREITSLKDLQEAQQNEADKGLKNLFPVVAGQNFISASPRPAESMPLGHSKDRRTLFDAMGFHPKVVAACSKLFADGHSSGCILPAVIAVLSELRKATSSKADGADLVNSVLSTKSPILQINRGETDSEKSEQEGFFYLMRGLVGVMRNPHAHDLRDVSDHHALHCMGFASLLLRCISIKG